VLDLVSKFTIECEQIHHPVSAPVSASAASTQPIRRTMNNKSNTKEIRYLTQSVLHLISKYFDDGDNCSSEVGVGVNDDYDEDVGYRSADGTDNIYVIHSSSGGECDDDIILLDET